MAARLRIHNIYRERVTYEKKSIALEKVIAIVFGGINSRRYLQPGIVGVIGVTTEKKCQPPNTGACPKYPTSDSE